MKLIRTADTTLRPMLAGRSIHILGYNYSFTGDIRQTVTRSFIKTIDVFLKQIYWKMVKENYWNWFKSNFPIWFNLFFKTTYFRYSPIPSNG